MSSTGTANVVTITNNCTGSAQINQTVNLGTATNPPDGLRQGRVRSELQFFGRRRRRQPADHGLRDPRRRGRRPGVLPDGPVPVERHRPRDRAQRQHRLQGDSNTEIRGALIANETNGGEVGGYFEFFNRTTDPEDPRGKENIDLALRGLYNMRISAYPRSRRAHLPAAGCGGAAPRLPAGAGASRRRTPPAPASRISPRLELKEEGDALHRRADYGGSGREVPAGDRPRPRRHRSASRSAPPIRSSTSGRRRSSSSAVVVERAATRLLEYQEASAGCRRGFPAALVAPPAVAVRRSEGEPRATSTREARPAAHGSSPRDPEWPGVTPAGRDPGPMSLAVQRRADEAPRTSSARASDWATATSSRTCPRAATGWSAVIDGTTHLGREASPWRAASPPTPSSTPVPAGNSPPPDMPDAGYRRTLPVVRPVRATA